ncbi:MAG: non-canonical purine NTP pyrophosphatase [Pseudomonadota bacterium]
MSRKFTDKQLLVATHNVGKLDEMRQIFAALDIVVSGAKDHNLAEPDETEDTFVGNARIKAHAAAQATGLPALSDDSGIQVDALNGAPGVYTADWAETPDGRDFMLAMTKTNQLLEEANAPHPRTARFCSTLVLAWPDGHDEAFDGYINGHLVWPPRGRAGHGYDPIFVPDGYTVTFGEMDWAEKNRISHRARSIEKLVACVFDQ